MLKLWCAGKLETPLGNCPKDVNRLRSSCLFCRMRRWFYGKFTLPPSYIEYTYKSFHYEQPVIFQGRKCVLIAYPHVKIDPRGHFTMLRVSFIKVVDSLMLKLKRTKPLIEFCEFAANYPTW